MMGGTCRIALLLVAAAAPVQAEQVFTNEDLMKYRDGQPIADDETSQRLQQERENDRSTSDQWLKDLEIGRLRQRLEDEKEEKKRLEQQLKTEQERRERAEEDRLIIIPQRKLLIDKKPK